MIQRHARYLPLNILLALAIVAAAYTSSDGSDRSQAMRPANDSLQSEGIDNSRECMHPAVDTACVYL